MSSEFNFSTRVRVEERMCRRSGRRKSSDDQTSEEARDGQDASD